MAYAYCVGCEAPLGPPTLGELIVGRMDCKCGSYRLIDDEERVIVLDDIGEVIKQARQFFTGRS